MTKIPCRIYSQLLRLYPRQFYSEFSDDMVTTLDALLQDQFRVSVLQGLLVWVGEVIWLVVCICQEHVHVNREKWGGNLMTHHRLWSWHTLIPIVLFMILGLSLLVFRQATVFAAC